jgi:glycosyltransferase involved in cell wall biosynthesis
MRAHFMPEDFCVSVIVCTYNRAKQLSKIIGLLRNQHYLKDKYEIIVVDNGSTDDTKSMVDGLKKFYR